MRAYQTRQVIPDSHTLTIQLPPEVPAGPAELIVLYPDDAQLPAHAATAEDLASLFVLLNGMPASQRSRDEIDQQILAERDSWD